MSRTLYPSGGAYLVWNSTTLRAQKEWSVTDDLKTFKTSEVIRGELDERIADVVGKLSMAPVAIGTGSTIATLLGKLIPFTSGADIGKYAFPVSDLPAVIQTATGGTSNAGTSLTYSAAALTKPPALNFHPAKPLISDFELSLLIAAGAKSNADGAYVTVADSSFSEPGINTSNLLFDAYTITIGGVAVEVDKDGIVMTPSYTWEPVQPAVGTTVNFRLTAIGFTFEFTPLAWDVGDFYDGFFPIPSNVGIGAPVTGAGLGTALVISGSASGKLKISAYNVAPTKGGPQFDPKNSRMKKVSLTAYQTSGHTVGAYIAIGTVA